MLLRFATEEGRAPKQAELTEGVRLGNFLHSISGNWRGKAKTTLTREQMDAIEACPLLAERVTRKILPLKEKIACVLKLEKKPSPNAELSVDFDGYKNRRFL